MPRHSSGTVLPRRSPGTADSSVLAGRFAMLDQIGAGGMGSVWRAVDLRSGEVVAVKVLGHHTGSLLARFVREQAVRIRHPHVAAPTGWAADDDVVLLSMDLVSGGSVTDLLAEHGPLPAGYVARLVEQVLLALAAVHGAGLVHRDLKPSNLLLEATGEGPPHVRLADFGVAAAVDDRRFTTTPGAIGTDGYMAPEQEQGAPPEPVQDLYALGRVAWQLATGVPPSRQDRIPSHPLRPLLERLLVRDPAQRVPSAEAALHLLRRLEIPWEPGPPVPDRLGPAPAGPRRGTDWAGWLAVAGCTAALLGCLTALLGWWP
ncbi:MAG: serine/threonine-protein kinase [Nocardioides sp.]|uniref:serine/threonine-protein kinase n=1 Tax=Nocardioides sp. TaxID=35761 RepID=UPI003F07218A